jgi:hypothetical protein
MIKVSKSGPSVQTKFERNKNLFPFAIHLIALLISSLFFMHVQVRQEFKKKETVLN